MKLLAAHTSPTLAATLAAAAISLSVFLLPGSAIQSGATPLLPALGVAAGRVSANLPLAHRHARRPKAVVHRAAASVRVSTSTPRVFVQRRPSAPAAPPVRRRVHVRRVEHPVVISAASVAAVTPSVSSSVAPTATARSRGHDRGHRQHAFALAPRAHGHGQALGHSTPPGHEHSHGNGKGREQHAPAGTAPAPVSASAPHGNGGDNGHKKGDR